ncbi:oligopeptide ABC transporter permease [Tetragenococcus koreensis]|uniref:Oligopeptide ABC transporter permease protein n=1 Tax=Tetragenococcus koreensis TaxID=290335 RepID=A0AAN4UA89_9ENTE|nr:oligopeptide ABC transporter permease [Tetragenococcus koreensis]AYW45835.1 peptide ABC transporter permease [Tetragenococcus koreensis]MCF1616681.1 ABC transporter permease [Tetragenococcus koreensis]MCF1621652.1 ABC transporter permease [Tetragenococcus koreensis]MCF1627030.1 ABC transporter permease [Tetragenococcus koreensis]MCF1630956.1 ABC transporter permease [Tetragenococcus koreensis]
MWKTILRRILLMIPQVIILSVLIFLIAQAMPGDPFTGLINPNQDPAEIARMREAAGLNDPWYQQYFRWIGNALQGDFGDSFLYRMPVANLLAGRITNTLYLSALTIVLTYLIAIPLGILAGRFQDSFLDKTVVVYNFFSFAVPIFIFALIMLFAFGYRLGWFPTGGSIDGGLSGMDAFWNRVYHLILPAITQALLGTSVTIQYLRSEIIDAKSLDFVRTARSKGVPTNKVFSRHIFRNAFLPVASQLGYEITELIAGSVVIEQIFSYPGVGKLFIDSIVQRDYAVITSLTLILGLATLIGTLISDIVMSIVDPRIRIE